MRNRCGRAAAPRALALAARCVRITRCLLAQRNPAGAFVPQELGREKATERRGRRSATRERRYHAPLRSSSCTHVRHEGHDDDALRGQGAWLPTSTTTGRSEPRAARARPLHASDAHATRAAYKQPWARHGECRARTLPAVRVDTRPVMVLHVSTSRHRRILRAARSNRALQAPRTAGAPSDCKPPLPSFGILRARCERRSCSADGVGEGARTVQQHAEQRARARLGTSTPQGKR